MIFLNIDKRNKYVLTAYICISICAATRFNVQHEIKYLTSGADLCILPLGAEN